MMKPKIIKNEREYDSAIARMESLMLLDDPDQDQLDEMELLTKLIEIYEDEKWKINPPSAIDAIKFRMDQQGLSQSDLIPYIGSKSRVSEVLSGKRGPSKEMISKLHEGLGIPLEVLLTGESPEKAETASAPVEWDRYPVAEMLKRGWISAGKVRDTITDYRAVMKSFSAGFPCGNLSVVRLRNGAYRAKKPDVYAVDAWRIRVLQIAKAEKLESPYSKRSITVSFRQELARLSYLSTGPVLAKEFLNKNGIHLVVLSHLNHTYIDGAAMLLPDGSPVIALTLRFDRLDNFWFVLFHELAHIYLHLEYDNNLQYVEDLSKSDDSIEEKNADRWASESLISDENWKTSGLNDCSTEAEVIAFSKSNRMNPAIAAGRIRREFGNYKLFTKLIGNGKVRSLFPDKDSI
jgi:HTH-type transcriptional regulator/antitoxin HigA